MEDYFKHRPHANVYQTTATEGDGTTNFNADKLKAAIASVKTAEQDGCEAMIKILWGMGISVMVNEFSDKPIAVLPQKYKEALDKLKEQHHEE